MKKIILPLSAIIIFLPIIYCLYILNNLSFSESFECGQFNQPIVLTKKGISQSFIVSGDNIHAILLKPATYTKIANGKIIFTIKNDRNDIIYSIKKSAVFIIDNQMYELEVPKEVFKKNELYFLNISYDIKKISRTPIAFWATEKDCYHGNLRAGEEKSVSNDLILIQKFSDGNLLTNVGELINRISQYKPIWLKKEKILLLFTLYFLLILISIRLTAKKIF